MARVIPPPVAAPITLEVVLDGKSFHVEASLHETMADVRRAIFRELGRGDADDESWPLHTASGVQALSQTKVERCNAWMGFKFHLTRPGRTPAVSLHEDS